MVRNSSATPKKLRRYIVCGKPKGNQPISRLPPRLKVSFLLDEESPGKLRCPWPWEKGGILFEFRGEPFLSPKKKIKGATGPLNKDSVDAQNFPKSGKTPKG